MVASARVAVVEGAATASLSLEALVFRLELAFLLDKNTKPWNLNGLVNMLSAFVGSSVLEYDAAAATRLILNTNIREDHG